MNEAVGWIVEDHVERFLRHLSHYVGYRYDAADEDALIGALDHTDDESGDGWFSYPLDGSPPLVVSLARPVGSSVVMVRVEGAVDDILRARISTMVDLMSDA